MVFAVARPEINKKKFNLKWISRKTVITGLNMLAKAQMITSFGIIQKIDLTLLKNKRRKDVSQYVIFTNEKNALFDLRIPLAA